MFFQVPDITATYEAMMREINHIAGVQGIKDIGEISNVCLLMPAMCFVLVILVSALMSLKRSKLP